MRTLLYWRLASLAWIGVIWTLSSSPMRSENSRSLIVWFLEWISNGQLGEQLGWWINLLARKTAHTLEFAILAGLLYLASGSRGRSAWLAGAAGAALFGILDEFHQIWVPGRGASPLDCVLDAAGGVIGATVLARRHRDPVF